MLEVYQNKYINKRDIKTYHLSVPYEKRALHLAEGVSPRRPHERIHTLTFINIYMPIRTHCTFLFGCNYLYIPQDFF